MSGELTAAIFGNKKPIERLDNAILRAFDVQHPPFNTLWNSLAK